MEVGRHVREVGEGISAMKECLREGVPYFPHTLLPSRLSLFFFFQVYREKLCSSSFPPKMQSVCFSLLQSRGREEVSSQSACPIEVPLRKRGMPCAGRRRVLVVPALSGESIGIYFHAGKAYSLQSLPAPAQENMPLPIPSHLLHCLPRLMPILLLLIFLTFSFLLLPEGGEPPSPPSLQPAPPCHCYSFPP